MKTNKQAAGSRQWAAVQSLKFKVQSADTPGTVAKLKTRLRNLQGFLNVAGLPHSPFRIPCSVPTLRWDDKFPIPHSLFRICLLLLVCSTLSISLFSQKYDVRGVLQDSMGAPLEMATVMLLQASDSSLAAFTRSEADGSFELKNQPSGNYLLRATYIGYRNHQQVLTLNGGGTFVDVGTLKLEPQSTLLGEVQITGEANPVQIKKDTIEFNAGSFNVKDNAVVEDLLKKMPGVEIERDGTVRAQGEVVKNVLVDGKKFFGTDPKAATKNLPADAVDKVQVYDKKSDQATFSGVDDGSREKTINLQLKEDKKKGWFGRVAAGGGADLTPTSNTGRYESNLTLNRFKPNQQLSVLGMGNNVNEAGFSIDDYMAYSGAMRQMMGGGGGSVRLEFSSDSDNGIPLSAFGNNDGFLTTWAGGVNFNQEFTPKTELNGSYFYSRPLQNFSRSYQRQSFLPEGTFYTNGSSEEETLANNHRVNATFDQKIDSFNTVQLATTLAMSDRHSESVAKTENFNADQQLTNGNNRKFSSDATGTNWNNNLLYRHKFAKKGRNVTLNGTFGLNFNDSESQNLSENFLYGDDGTPTSIDTVLQDQTFINDVTTLGARATYTEPLGKKRYVELSYAYNSTQNEADKDVFDIVEGQNQFNDLLSNAYTNNFSYHRAGAGFRINKKTWNGSFGLDAQYAVLDGEVTSGVGQSVRQDFRHLLPRLDYNYEFSQSRRFSADYNARVTAPTVQQLQPVPDVSDPLNVYLGNPNLKPEYANNLNLHYVQFNPGTMRSFFAGVFTTYTQDRIVNAQVIDSLLRRAYRPVNVDADWRINGTFSFGIPWKKIDSRFNIRSDVGFNRGYNFVNTEENTTTGWSITQAFSWEFEPVEWFSMSAGADYNWYRTAYSFEGAIDQQYLQQFYSADANAELPWNMAANTNLEYVVNNGLSDGFNTAVPIWNASVSKFLLKNKALEVSLVVRDLLNRNVGIQRVTNLNYVEDQRVSSLGRYGLLKLTYNLNRQGGGSGVGTFRVMMRR
ncbi:MAG: TonB-dependent receptor [Saprospiraceae bacterium]|nr:TonB-dependent receptor [Saprospiraceae bacterium]